MLKTVRKRKYSCGFICWINSRGYFGREYSNSSTSPTCKGFPRSRRKMKAIELSGFEGLNCLRVVEVEKPKPGANEVLIDVKAAGINYAELELTKGKYNVFKKPPFIMGFEASGVVVEVGS